MHFEAMFDAEICCFSAKVRQSFFSDPFGLHPKPLQPDDVNSHGDRAVFKQDMPGNVAYPWDGISPTFYVYCRSNRLWR